jgi:hypothetical protein
MNAILENNIEIPSSRILTRHILISIGSTLLIVVYVMFIIVKKGSKLGEKMVVHPVLMPDIYLTNNPSSQQK